MKTDKEDPSSSENVQEFVETLTDEMHAFCGPIFIAPGLFTYPEQMIDSGTFSLVDTGQRRLLVTCHHIWEAYLKFRSLNGDAVLCLALGEGTPVIAFGSPEKQLIDVDSNLDLVVFDFEPSQIRVNNSAVNHKKAWFPVKDWPLLNVHDGDYVVLMGFPGKLIVKDGHTCSFSGQVLPFRVTGIGRERFYLFNDPNNSEVFSYTKNELGGQSGSPAFKLCDEGARLVGFVKSGYKHPATEGMASDDSSIFSGSLLLTHASFLRQDGTLSRP